MLEIWNISLVTKLKLAFAQITKEIKSWSTTVFFLIIQVRGEYFLSRFDFCVSSPWSLSLRLFLLCGVLMGDMGDWGIFRVGESSKEEWFRLLFLFGVVAEESKNT